jgi:hypothetical protein
MNQFLIHLFAINGPSLKEEDAAIRKFRIALCTGYLVAGMTAIWCGIVVSRLAELLLSWIDTEWRPWQHGMEARTI